MNPFNFKTGIAITLLLCALVYLWDICTGRIRKYLRKQRAIRASKRAMPNAWKGRAL